MNTVTALQKEDFACDQEIRWCPGCGDYAIINAIQRVAPALGIPKENFVFVSGIGCSSRLPYYMNTYGFHTIHGRAMTVATGLKCARPDLSVWVITGDGDALSIGGNHFLHGLRRNVDINVLLFNNRIYGLTKGQYSPTSELGKKTRSSPFGSIEQPVNAVSVAFAAEATFIARSLDVFTPHLTEVIKQAALHKGVSFVEIYQNCLIFNDGAFKDISNRTVRDERVLELVHGKPLLFGANRNKGLVLENHKPRIVTVGENGIREEDVLVHNEDDAAPAVSYLLGRIGYPEFPVPIGIFRRVQKPTYNDLLLEQMENVELQKGKGVLAKLLKGNESWEIKES